MTTIVSIIRQDLEVSPVTSIVVTSITRDDDQGDYYRELRFFDANSGQVITVRVRGATADAIHVPVPASDF